MTSETESLNSILQTLRERALTVKTLDDIFSLSDDILANFAFLEPQQSNIRKVEAATALFDYLGAECFVHINILGSARNELSKRTCPSDRTSS